MSEDTNNNVQKRIAFLERKIERLHRAIARSTRTHPGPSKNREKLRADLAKAERRLAGNREELRVLLKGR